MHRTTQQTLDVDDDAFPTDEDALRVDNDPLAEDDDADDVWVFRIEGAPVAFALAFGLPLGIFQ